MEKNHGGIESNEQIMLVLIQLYFLQAIWELMCI